MLEICLFECRRRCVAASRSNFVVTKTMNDDVGWTDDDDGTRERLPTYFSKTDFPRLKELAARITKDLTYLNLRYLHII